MARDLETRDLTLAGVDDIGLGEIAAFGFLHIGDRHVGEALIGVGDHSDLLHACHGQQQAFHFHRIDVFAADLEHVLVAAEKAQVSIGTDNAGIAGVKPAVIVVALGGFRGLIVVPQHHAVAPEHDFPRLADRLLLTGFGIDHLEVKTGREVARALRALLHRITQ